MRYFLSVLLLCFFQLGCSVQSEEQKIQKLKSIERFSDLAGLEDEDSVVMAKIREIEDSTDPKLDQEDKVEIMSAKDKIIIVGDSWGSFPCLYNSIGKMIRDVDAKITEDNRCLRTTKLGVEAFVISIFPGAPRHDVSRFGSRSCQPVT